MGLVTLTSNRSTFKLLCEWHLSSKFAHAVTELFAIRDGRTDIQTHRQRAKSKLATLIAPLLTGTGEGHNKKFCWRRKAARRSVPFQNCSSPYGGSQQLHVCNSLVSRGILPGPGREWAHVMPANRVDSPCSAGDNPSRNNGDRTQLLVFHWIYFCMSYRFWDIQRQKTAWPWNWG